MAELEVSYYDYNGVLFCFGELLNTGSQVCAYVVATVDSTHKYRADIKDTVNFPNIFNINTYEHATSNAPKTLSSGTHTVVFDFYNSADAWLNGGMANQITISMHNTLRTPSLSYDNDKKTITVTNVGTGRYFLEIRRKNRNKVNTKYTEVEKDYLYTTLMKGLESGKYYEAHPHTSFVDMGYKDEDSNLYEEIPKARYMWRSNVRTIIVFDSDAEFTDTEKQTYYNLACEALDDLEGVTGKTFSLRDQATRKGDTDFNDCVDADYYAYCNDEDDGYRMIIRFGKENTMHLAGTKNNKPIEGGNGRWGNWIYYDPYWGLMSCHPAIAVDAAAKGETVKHVVYEEIMQSLGMGSDSYTQETSLHWDPHWSNPESYVGIDKRILELVCSEDVCAWSGFDFINEWDTPCILFKNYTDSDLVFDVSALNDDEEYYATAWVARDGGTISYATDGFDNDPYSMREQISFTKTKVNSHPGEFKWTNPKTKGGGFNLTAEEWNRLEKHVEALLFYKNKNVAGFEPKEVSRGDRFFASDYNRVGAALKTVSGYGAFIPTVSPGQDITADKSSDDPSKNIMNVLVSELNAIKPN